MPGQQLGCPVLLDGVAGAMAIVGFFVLPRAQPSRLHHGVPLHQGVGPSPLLELKIQDDGGLASTNHQTNLPQPLIHYADPLARGMLTMAACTALLPIAGRSDTLLEPLNCSMPCSPTTTVSYRHACLTPTTCWISFPNAQLAAYCTWYTFVAMPLLSQNCRLCCSLLCISYSARSCVCQDQTP
jgi:hypothetical protein